MPSDVITSPIGDVGLDADRDQSGRFKPGNRAAMVVGARSAAFWQAHDAVLREIRRDVITDAGFTDDDAPRALALAAEAIAQAALLRDAAFLRLVESGGPTTSAGRTRRAFTVWQAATDRLEKHLRLVGLHRAPRPTLSFAEQVRELARQNRPDVDRD